MNNAKPVIFAAGAAISDPLRFGPKPPNADYQRYIIARLKTGTWTPATLSVKVSTDGTLFYPLYVTSSYPGIASLVTTAWRGFLIPAGFELIKLWSQDGSGNDTAQVAGNTLEIILV